MADDNYELNIINRQFKRLTPAQQQEAWLKFSEVMEGYSKDASEQFEVEMMSDYTEQAIKHYENWGKMQGLSTGYEKLDEHTKGLVGGEITIIAGKTSYGKQQRNSETIPTPYGDKKFGDLQVGDYVFGSDGKPTKVTGVYPQGKLDVYRVNFSDGSYLDTGENHLWTFIRKDRASRTITSRQIKEKLPHSSYHLPMACLEYRDNKQPVPAYELGMYLADGSTSNSRAVRITKSRGRVSDYLQELDPELRRYDHISTCGYLTASLKHSRLGKYLLESKLIGLKSAEKFIPNEWFNKSVQVRKELLHGLMDGDGTFSRRPRYSTTSEKLADGVVRLVTSMGYMARKSIVKHHKCHYFTVYLNGIDFNPFKLSKHKDTWSWNSKNSRKYRYVKSVDILPPDEATCISVEAKDNLYVADTRFNIVTHNTTLAINIANQVALAGQPVLFVTLEMTKPEITSRFMSINGGNTTSYVKVASMIAYQVTNELDWKSIDGLVQKFVKEFTNGLIVIDHLHYFTRELENVSEDLGRITKELKKNAIQYNVPILLVSHVRKTQGNQEAGIDDLRGSSYIAQDADIVLMVGRDIENETKLMVTIEKNRNRGYNYKDNQAIMFMDGIKIYNAKPLAMK